MCVVEEYMISYVNKCLGRKVEICCTVLNEDA
jgi:hypothetical protein